MNWYKAGKQTEYSTETNTQKWTYINLWRIKDTMQMQEHWCEINIS
jgi:predicted SnoaL-like aldol condensation-catalyzing enzyme